MSDVMSIDAEFSAAMAAHDLRPTGIVAGGCLHRFDGPEDKLGKKSAWYVLHGDDIPAGSFGNWRTELYKSHGAFVSAKSDRDFQAFKALIPTLARSCNGGRIDDADRTIQSSEVYRG